MDEISTFMQITGYKFAIDLQFVTFLAFN